MPVARVIPMAVAGLLIVLGFYLIRYGVLAGLVERSIRMIRYSHERAAGQSAVGWGLFYMGLGMVMMIVAAYLLLAAVKE